MSCNWDLAEGLTRRCWRVPVDGADLIVRAPTMEEAVSEVRMFFFRHLGWPTSGTPFRGVPFPVQMDWARRPGPAGVLFVREEGPR